MQVKRDDHTFSSKNCMETKVHYKKSGHHSTYLDDYIIQRQRNKQSGFNAEQIDKDKYLESKNHLKIKSKMMSYHNKTTQKPFDYQINK
jgi:hypothetical protein